MSIIPHLVVVLLLSFLFFHGSSARCFGLINHQPAKRLHLLSKTMAEEKLKHYRASTPSLSPEEESSEAVRDKEHESHGEKARKEANNNHHHHHGKNNMNKNGEKDGADSSVTWKVREKKRGEPQAEFNLDYLPARTHPPVHN